MVRVLVSVVENLIMLFFRILFPLLGRGMEIRKTARQLNRKRHYYCRKTVNKSYIYI
jgi:hypothetical protein